jgi:mono/diheme cytochrome c family protein
LRGGILLRVKGLCFIHALALFLIGTTMWTVPSGAQQPAFHNAPASASATKNPFKGNAGAAAAGQKVYAQNCMQCHGNHLQGMGPAPALDSAAVRTARPGELFWFITTGKLTSGMPAWSGLPTAQRWQIVTFLQSQTAAKTASK